MIYKEALSHPKWQKKRLEIMSRDNWKCKGCGTEEETLHVHHKIYIKGRMPWEYDDDKLETYCLKCHEMIHEFKNEYDKRNFLEKKYFLSIIFNHLNISPIFHKSFIISPWKNQKNISMIMHIPSSMYRTFPLSVDEILEKMENNPESLIELRNVIIYG